MHLRGAGLAVTAAVLLPALAACGSDDDGPASSGHTASPAASATATGSASGSASGSVQTQEWADGLCTAASTWRTRLDDASASLSDPADLSVNGVRTSLSQMASATSDFAAELRGLGAPDTEAGDRAQQEVSDLGQTLEEQGRRIHETLERVATARQLAAALPVLSTSLSTMGTAFGATARELSSLDGAGELRRAFGSSAVCAAAGIG